MARRFRSGDAVGLVHGYRGRQFTLVTRGVGGLPTADKTVDVALVQVWRDEAAAMRPARPPSRPHPSRKRKTEFAETSRRRPTRAAAASKFSRARRDEA